VGLRAGLDDVEKRKFLTLPIENVMSIDSIGNRTFGFTLSYSVSSFILFLAV
jgi:hypothetical protein